MRRSNASDLISNLIKQVKQADTRGCHLEASTIPAFWSGARSHATSVNRPEIRKIVPCFISIRRIGFWPRHSRPSYGR